MKHVDFFRKRHQMSGEQVVAVVEGWIGSFLGKGQDAQHHGILILSDRRLAFVRKGFVGSVFKSISLERLGSVERRSFMGYNVATFNNSHDDLTFKSFNSGELEKLLSSIEERKLSSGHATSGELAGIYSEHEMLGILHAEGELSDQEYKAARAHLLKHGSLYSDSTETISLEADRERPLRTDRTGQSTGDFITEAAYAVATVLLFLVGGWFFFSAEAEKEEAPQTPQRTAPIAAVKKVPTARTWGDMEICGHVVQTYFYIVMPPRLLDIEGSKYTFESEAGHRYDCRVKDGQAMLNWINLTGEPMSSDSTRFSVGADGKLTVSTLEMAITYD